VHGTAIFWKVRSYTGTNKQTCKHETVCYRIQIIVFILESELLTLDALVLLLGYYAVQNCIVYSFVVCLLFYNTLH
jgi:uncharacterized membrane protein